MKTYEIRNDNFLGYLESVHNAPKMPDDDPSQLRAPYRKNAARRTTRMAFIKTYTRRKY